MRMYLVIALVATLGGVGGITWVNSLKSKINTLEETAVATDVALRACSARNLNLSEDRKSDAQVDARTNTIDGLLGAAAEWMLGQPVEAD